MSDAAKFEPNTSNPTDHNTLQRGSQNHIKYQDVRLVQSNSSYYNSDRHHGNHQHYQWNPPEPNAESHWDEFAAASNSSTAKSGDKRRRNNNDRQNRSERESKAIISKTADDVLSSQNNTYEGVRREFVNSKNRVPLSSKTTGRNSNTFNGPQRLLGILAGQRASTRNSDRKHQHRLESGTKKSQRNVLTISGEKQQDNVLKENKINDSQRIRRNEVNFYFF